MFLSSCYVNNYLRNLSLDMLLMKPYSYLYTSSLLQPWNFTTEGIYFWRQWQKTNDQSKRYFNKSNANSIRSRIPHFRNLAFVSSYVLDSHQAFTEKTISKSL
jgi:hypothetical protein